MAIIYSDRITARNTTPFSHPHFTFDDSLYEFFLIVRYVRCGISDGCDRRKLGLRSVACLFVPFIKD